MKINSSLRHWLFHATSAAMLAFTGMTASASSLIYQTDFEGDAGTFPSDWLRAINGENGLNSFLELNGNGQLVMSRKGDTLGASVAAFYNGPIGTGESNEFTDGIIRTSLRYSANEKFGILARAQILSYNPTGYFAYFSGSALVISSNPNGNNETIIASTAVTGTLADDYILEFTLAGANLQAALYASDGTTLISSTSATDSTYTEGYIGLRTRIQGNNRTALYNSFEVHAIPEPGTAAVLLFSAPLLVGALKYRGKRP